MSSYSGQTISIGSISVGSISIGSISVVSIQSRCISISISRPLTPASEAGGGGVGGGDSWPVRVGVIQGGDITVGGVVRISISYRGGQGSCHRSTDNLENRYILFIENRNILYIENRNISYIENRNIFIKNRNIIFIENRNILFIENRNIYYL